MDEVSGKAKAVQNATKGISTAAAAGVAALAGMAVSAGKYADDLNTAAKQSGFSQDFLQSLDYASDRIDVTMESVIGAGTKLKKNMGSMSEDVAAAFNRLQVGVYASTGGLRDVEGVFQDLLIALSLVPNETERDVLAMTILGKSADELAGLIDDGGAAFRELSDEAHAAGLILSQDALDGANAFNDGMDELKAKTKAAFLEAGSSLAENLLPELDDLVESLSSVLQWFAELDGGTIKFAMGMMAAMAVISPIAGTISNVTGAVSGLAGLLPKASASAVSFATTGGAALDSALDTMEGGLASLWAVMAANPVAATIAGIGLLTGALVLLYNKSETFRDFVNNVFDSVVEGIKTFIEWLDGAMQKLRDFFGFDGGGGKGYIGKEGWDTAPVSIPRVQGFAQGGVFEPNNPMLIGVGDNNTEREIIAPESALAEVFGEVARGMQSQGRQNINVKVQFTGSLAQLGRVMAPVITTELDRQGPTV